jgi:hypothetical protein
VRTLFPILAGTALLCLALATPAQALPPPTPIILPPISYTPDDGLGLGIYLAAQRGVADSDVQAGGSRPWVWDLGLIGMIYLKPKPVAWGFASTFSLFPRSPRGIELVLGLGSHGWRQDQWFGLGNDSVRDTRRQQEDLDVSQRWHRFGLYQFRGDARIYYRLVPHVDLFFAAIVTYNRISVRENTLLARQQAAGELLGTEGGLFLSLDVGLRIDRRDSRIDPTRGGLLVLTVQGTFGSPGPSGRIAVDARSFLGTPRGEVVFAGSLLAQRQFGAVPFYEYGVIVGPEPRPRHLSGVGGVRGISRGRIRAPDGLLLHGEVRFRPPGFSLGKLIELRIEPIVFIDAARVGVLGAPNAGPLLHPGLGAGCRFVIREQALVRIDVGTGPERQLEQSGEKTRWNVGVYGTIGQSF